VRTWEITSLPRPYGLPLQRVFRMRKQARLLPHESVSAPDSLHHFNCCAGWSAPPRLDSGARARHRCSRWLGAARSALCFLASLAITRLGLGIANCFRHGNMEACPRNLRCPVSVYRELVQPSEGRATFDAAVFASTVDALMIGNKTYSNQLLLS